MSRTKWYENTVFYEIYVPSFCDSNGDGIGDLQGVTLKIPYLRELGIRGIWLTPFYPSPKIDNGYDISDYRNVDCSYGTLGDFDELLKEAHRAGIRVIIDMVLNHTSDKHPWFQESRKDIGNRYRDYYLWEKEIPNNWESFFDGSAWEYDTRTDMYYYHAFSREQVCLNWACERVRQECLDILRFWLDRGVDGFRLDVINFLKTDRSAFCQNNPIEDGVMRHVYDKNQKGIYEAIQLISSVVHSYPDKYLLGEIGEDDLYQIRSYIGEGLLDSAFQFNLGSVETLDVAYLVEQIGRMEGEKLYPTLFFSSHDMRRHFDRLCGKDIVKAKLLAAFLLTAKGIPFLYQGEEMPMADVIVERPEDLKDVQGKYAYEKMKKEGEEKALLYAKERSRDYSRGMVDWQMVGNQSENSLLSLYRKLLKIRSEHPALSMGNYGEVCFSEGRLYYQRVNGQEKIGIYLDFEGNKFEGNEMEGSHADVILEIRDENRKIRGLLKFE